MSEVLPLVVPDETSSAADPRNMVSLEVGLPGDTWWYCVQRDRLAKKSEWFRAMLMGPLAPKRTDPPPLLKLEHIEKRAFDHFLRYLNDEPVIFQSVSTARATLDVAHQYLCPDLARLAIKYLDENLDSSTVLEIYQSLDLYANLLVSRCTIVGSSNVPSAPPEPEDEAGEIAAACTELLIRCLGVIDADPVTILSQERFEELRADEVKEIACRDTLRLPNEAVLFSALDRWAASDCRKRGIEPTASNKRDALSDEVWYSVRYLLMTDREFIKGPMARGILSSEESAFIFAQILGHPDKEESTVSMSSPLWRLSNTPRIGTTMYHNQGCSMMKTGKKERQDNRKNRRKECAGQACARICTCFYTNLKLIKKFVGETTSIFIIKMQLSSSYELHCRNVNRRQEHNSTAFSNRMKALVDQLSIAETEYNKRKEDVSSDYMEVDEESKEVSRSQQREGGRKRKHETHKFRGRQSIFKRPEGPAPRSIYRSVPDYHRNPHKWIKYSLDDVSNEDMTDRSNTHAALSFLKELKARKEAKLMKMDIDKTVTHSNDNKISFRSRKNESTSTIAFKKPESESIESESLPVIVCTDDKPMFKNSKIIMPEYVVGQKQVKKIKKNKLPNTSCSSRQIKLDHLQDLDEDEN
ncbi:hypothetical protein KPH14_004676 [Odynerus spinipes]|uniref:BACK domain-containing protein n=1 Tax=Odynerus spinipes TaxID=1348599 RepID=A0AAD9RMQ0_9HYME|nr:hypothetical protein KPH14_004676 [Odynerus spinipes]